MAPHQDPTKGKTTTDHIEIRKWAEPRDGHPARVKDSAAHSRKGRSGGILRIDFGGPEESLERISWDEFFRVFDENHLAFLYQEETSDGGTSRFFKFVRGDDAPKGASRGTKGRAAVSSSPGEEEGIDSHEIKDGEEDEPDADVDEDDDDDEEEGDHDLDHSETALDEDGREIIEDVDAEAADGDDASGPANPSKSR